MLVLLLLLLLLSKTLSCKATFGVALLELGKTAPYSTISEAAFGAEPLGCKTPPHSNSSPLTLL